MSSMNGKSPISDATADPANSSEMRKDSAEGHVASTCAVCNKLFQFDNRRSLRVRIRVSGVRAEARQFLQLRNRDIFRCQPLVERDQMVLSRVAERFVVRDVGELFDGRQHENVQRAEEDSQRDEHCYGMGDFRQLYEVLGSLPCFREPPQLPVAELQRHSLFKRQRHWHQGAYRAQEALAHTCREVALQHSENTPSPDLQLQTTLSSAALL